MKDLKFEKLRERLEKLEWPGRYLFKFIVPSRQTNEIIEILPNEDFTTKKSGKGNYTSITSYVSVASEDEVIDIYKKAARVEGVISL